MKLPRVLLIIVVILLVLAIASCGISLLRFDEDVSPAGIPDLLQGLMPDPPPVDAMDIGTCRAGVSTGTIEFSGVCTISVEAASGPARRLELRNTGSGGIELRLRAPAAAERDLPAGNVERIVVPPDERAEVDVACRSVGGCRIRVG